MTSMILINALGRSGGSLLAWLTEGHPSLAVYPVEMRFAPRKHEWPNPSDIYRIYGPLEGGVEVVPAS